MVRPERERGSFRLAFGLALAGILALAVASVVAFSHGQTSAPSGSLPQRVVSLNVCTDQLLMLLVDPERIASVTYLSRDPRTVPSELLEIAQGVPVNHGLAEEVIAAQPDLVVGWSFSFRPTTQLLETLGYQVEIFDGATSLEGIRSNVRRMGALVGESERADLLIAEMDGRLEALSHDRPTARLRPVFADIGVNNWMPGGGSLASELAAAGGVRTLGETLGFVGSRQLPLETLVSTKPQVVAVSGLWSDPPSIATLALRHPAMSEFLDGKTIVELPESVMGCGTPLSIQVAEVLAEARRGMAD